MYSSDRFIRTIFVISFVTCLPVVTLFLFLSFPQLGYPEAICELDQLQCHFESGERALGINTNSQFRAPDSLVSSVGFTPFAILSNETETSTLTLQVDQSVLSVTAIAAGSSLPPAIDGTTINGGDRISLYDDGTNGDETAGDNIWSRGGFTRNNSGQQPGEFSTYYLYNFDITTITGTQSVDIFGQHTAMLVTVSPAEIVPVVDLDGASLQIAPYAYNSYLAGRIDLLKSNEQEGMEAVSSDIFSYLDGDDLDHVFFFPNKFIPNGTSGRSYPVKNVIENTGQSLFDYTTDFSSPNDLRSALLMNFTGSNGPTLHELIHIYAAFGLDNLGFHNCSSSAHWGAVGVGEGQLGGFDPTSLVNNGDGTYTVDSFGLFASGGDSVAYSQLEMYLMGMIPANQVDPIPVPVNIDCNSLSTSNGRTTFTADSISTVTIEQIQSQLNGPRNPSSETSKKDFSAAFVAVSDTPLTTSEMAYFNSRAKILSGDLDSSFLQSFPDATNNLGSINLATKSPPAISLELEVEFFPKKPRPGDTVELYVEVENWSPQTANNVITTINLPSQVTLVTAINEAEMPGETTISFPLITFEMGQIGSLEEEYVFVEFTIPETLTDTRSIEFEFTAREENEAISDSQTTALLINPIEIFLPMIRLDR